MKSDLLKSLAMKAKNRMIHNSSLGKACGYGDEPVDCKIRIIDDADNEFIEKVRFLVNGSENVGNPIKLLMSEEKLISMDARGKEKYLLETIEKYLKYRKMIESEKRSKIVY